MSQPEQRAIENFRFELQTMNKIKVEKMVTAKTYCLPEKLSFRKGSVRIHSSD